MANLLVFIVDMWYNYAMENTEKDDLRKYTPQQLALIYKQIIRLKLNKITEKDIYAMTGMSFRRIREIWKLYKETGKMPMPKERWRKAGEGRLLSRAQEKEIKNLIKDKNPNQLRF